ncbi:sensor histidine kinase [Kitasatospora sp. NPDC096140]|uniref:sensor histidine kinase n=1 Tax=Kitasatospora sp. NPDC096140 TaxID=3155425 RepID=UPI0033191AC0
MSESRGLSLLTRVPPGVFTALTWCAAMVYALAVYAAFPGQSRPIDYPQAGTSPSISGWLTLAAATAVTLAGSTLLRRRPLPAFALLLGGAFAASMALDMEQIPLLLFLTADVALGFLAAAGPRGTSLAAAVMALGALVGYPSVRLLLAESVSATAELADAMSVAVAWLIGNTVRQARDHTRTSRAQTAAQAITAERLRIARELHDLVAHNIGIIALQAGAARMVINIDPPSATEAMTAVETAGRETLAGLRRMLGALRQAEPDDPSGSAPLGPAPGLADVERLAAATAAAGVRVEVRWLGERRPLPPEIDLSAFRIVQESITNVVRHAGADSCQVSIDQRPEELSVEVLDDGHGCAAAAGTGYGLIGMRERVGLLRGEFFAAPRPEGGFRVTARLPLPTGAR